MNSSLDKYLDSLLAFTPIAASSHRDAHDYVCLIHVPVSGPEQVYSLAFGKTRHIMTVSKFQDTVWDYLQAAEESSDPENLTAPEVSVLQAPVDSEHPVFKYVDTPVLSACESYSDGCEGMDYYLLLWRRSGMSRVAESWEPYGRLDSSWTTLIGAMQALVSQHEFVEVEASLSY